MARTAVVEDTLIELLVKEASRAKVLEAIAAATKRGEPSSWAEIHPCKDAKVRRQRAALVESPAPRRDRRRAARRESDVLKPRHPWCAVGADRFADRQQTLHHPPITT